jgi:hypothetical protein
MGDRLLFFRGGGEATGMVGDGPPGWREGEDRGPGYAWGGRDMAGEGGGSLGDGHHRCMSRFIALDRPMLRLGGGIACGDGDGTGWLDTLHPGYGMACCIWSLDPSAPPVVRSP